MFLEDNPQKLISLKVSSTTCVEQMQIMQIVRGGKVLRLHDLLVIRGKTFAIVQQFKTPYNKTEKIRWKTFAIGG